MSTVAFQNRGLTSTQLQQTIDYIHTHLDRELSLEQIAAVIHISPTYFASLFKHSTGISPHQYVIQQRVKQAEVMLSKTNWARCRRQIPAGSQILPYKWVFLVKAT